ncbi:MAG: phospholipid carrier-dependent glycosyltransferase [Gammaproteobacteria bacterium]|nr:phospholipid carrier-dependent glycosyltransferase [Gammaproteobacteria bacterium]MBU1967996.1 phospholipid carrier-dependent glycosyltransferase [Gammaproteobacteria bacterium]
MYRHPGRQRSVWYVAAMLLAVFVYIYGLDSQHIPRNGDEDVYAHITRLTAQSGHWLPLQSELDNMRNTKPPLLFWQGIAATDWGSSWDRWHLRLPSVIYTLLTALLVLLLGKRLSGETHVGVTAALVFLAFFSTYRYGRPFLVNPAETFWLFLPFFTLLYWRQPGFESRWLIPLLFGVEIGIGLLYKSFALLAPVGLALAWWYLHHRDYRWREFLVDDAYKPVITGIVALAMFALWFALDPDPQAVWREFVVGENAGKFGAQGSGYWSQLLWGGSSIWALLLGYPLNAGLLALPVAAVFVLAYRQRFRANESEQLLWIWMAVLFVVFAIPSQRSARYLLEAMPGVALLCALYWQRIPRWVFAVALVLSAAVLLLLGWLALRLQSEMGGLYGWGAGLLWVAVMGLIVLALLRQEWTRDLTHVAALLAMLGLAVFLRPFDGAAGSFDAEAQRQVLGKAAWVPCNFRAHDEGYRFLLPGADVHGYHEQLQLTPQQLVQRYPLFAVQLPLQEDMCEGCRVIGRRLEIRGRHSGEELRAMLQGKVYEHLFVNEWLLESPVGMNYAQTKEEGCR